MVKMTHINDFMDVKTILEIELRDEPEIFARADMKWAMTIWTQEFFQLCEFLLKSREDVRNSLQQSRGLLEWESLKATPLNFSSIGRIQTFRTAKVVRVPV